MSDVRFLPASESALLVDFAAPHSEIRPDTIQRVHRLVHLLDHSPLPGILELTPSYTSLLIEFSTPTLTLEDVQSHVSFCLEQIGHIELPAAETREVPVFYGGEYGPDLGWVADHLRLTISQLVQAHCETIFTVAFFGFLPGFAYLEGWPAKYSVPRLDSPRLQVPAGSVALAGVQCGIYPQLSPGGWRLLGRTPLPLIDPNSPSFSPFSLGMKIRFYPANPSQWNRK
jgi:inhibitor of KinA